MGPLPEWAGAGGLPSPVAADSVGPSRATRSVPSLSWTVSLTSAVDTRGDPKGLRHCPGSADLMAEPPLPEALADTVVRAAWRAGSVADGHRGGRVVWQTGRGWMGIVAGG